MKNLQKRMQALHEKRHKGALTLSDLPSVGLAFILIAIIFGVGGIVLAEVNNQTSNSNATETINQGQTALTDLAGWLPIIGIVVAAAIIIGLVVRSLGAGQL